MQVDIDITDKCNFQCKYCTAADRTHFDNELSINEWRDIIYELYEWGVMDFNLAGGEPLLKDGIYELIKEILELKGVDLTLVTNGSLISNDLIEIKKNTPEFHLLISLDNISSTINELTRDKTDIVLDNIKLLISERVNFTVAQVITKLNIDSFFENKSLLKKLGVNNILVIKYIAAGGSFEAENELEISYEKWYEFLERLTIEKSKNINENISVSVACPWELYLPLIEQGYNIDDIYRIWNYKSPLLLDSYRNEREIGCHAGTTSINIAANGDVFPCSISGYNKALLCGNIRETNIRHIWKESDVLSSLRKIKISDISSDCEKCNLLKLCGGGCRIRAFYKTKKLHGKDLCCPVHSQK